MTPRQVIEHYGSGSVARASKALGVTRQTIYNWMQAGTVPQGWQSWCERDTAGKLRAVLQKPSEARA
jgi:transposase